MFLYCTFVFRSNCVGRLGRYLTMIEGITLKFSPARNLYPAVPKRWGTSLPCCICTVLFEKSIFWGMICFADRPTKKSAEYKYSPALRSGLKRLIDPLL